MPPVFGPRSPSKARLWSWAVPSATQVLAVGEHEEARLLAGHELLDHHPRAGAGGEDRVERRQRLAHGLGHGHALAGGEPVGLDHDRRARGRHVGAGGLGVGEGLAGGGRRAAGGGDLLGEGLGRLQPRRLAPGPEGGDAAGAQHVGHPLGQRRLGPDHHEVDPVRAAKASTLSPSRMSSATQVRLLGDAGVARRAPEPVAFGVLRERPGQRVLAPAAAEDQDVHAPRPPLGLARARVLWCGPAARKREDDGAVRGPAAGANAPEFTVSEISGAVKRVIEGEFGRVRVRGEIGRVSPAGLGAPLSRPEGRARLPRRGGLADRRRAAWRCSREEGMEVVATGRLTTFPGVVEVPDGRSRSSPPPGSAR